tara:strand:+ start:8414 stop:8989 length:576 start_codon:yes stop_codon:yes gene_type:complete
MLIKDIIKISLEYYDNNFVKIKDFFDKYYIASNIVRVEFIKGIHYINFYNKKNKKKVAYCKVNKLFDFIDPYNVLYWDWANVNTDYYNNDAKIIWDYGFNLINTNVKDENENFNKFLKIILLNSGLIIKNNLNLYLIIAIISYILKKNIISFKYIKSTNKFKLIYEYDKIVKKNIDNLYSYYYSVSEFKEL